VQIASNIWKFQSPSGLTTFKNVPNYYRFSYAFWNDCVIKVIMTDGHIACMGRQEMHTDFDGVISCSFLEDQEEFWRLTLWRTLWKSVVMVGGGSYCIRIITNAKLYNLQCWTYMFQYQRVYVCAHVQDIFHESESTEKWGRNIQWWKLKSASNSTPKYLSKAALFHMALIPQLCSRKINQSS
jgi:hypothetical protein